ncbi:MAG: OmpA family protein [Proteobacteria bacterium]|nr:OmpA family protein [Pseudomonadota bacterium]
MTLRFRHFATFAIIMAFVAGGAYNVEELRNYRILILLFGVLSTVLFWFLDYRTSEYLRFHIEQSNKIKEQLLKSEHISKPKFGILTASMATNLIFGTILFGWSVLITVDRFSRNEQDPVTQQTDDMAILINTLFDHPKWKAVEENMGILSIDVGELKVQTGELKVQIMEHVNSELKPPPGVEKDKQEEKFSVPRNSNTDGIGSELSNSNDQFQKDFEEVRKTLRDIKEHGGISREASVTAESLLSLASSFALLGTSMLEYLNNKESLPGIVQNAINKTLDLLFKILEPVAEAVGKEIVDKTLTRSPDHKAVGPPKLPEPVTFAYSTGKRDVPKRTVGNKLVNEVVQEFAALIDEYPMCLTIVEGHTDTVGAEDSNLLLSQMRARKVADRFRDKVEDDHLITIPYGESNLIKQTLDNIPEEANRLVRVVIQCLQ